MSKLPHVSGAAVVRALERFRSIYCFCQRHRKGILYGQENEMPGRLSEMAQKLRLLRNVGAHSDLGEIEEEDVPVLVDLCEAILEYIYRAPAKLELVQKRIYELKAKSEA